MSTALLEVRDLRAYFPVRTGAWGRITGVVKAVDGVSFDVFRGETLGLVGESGCGKSTLGRSVLRLGDATTGSIRFDGIELTDLRPDALRTFRKRMQLILQDPYASLNPRLSVREIITEPLVIHRLGSAPERERRMLELLGVMGLPEDSASRFPSEFSGGQRQRIGIARALAVRPELLVADEPISALDVSVQAQIVNLLMDLQEELALTYVFVAHDLKIVEHVSDRVAVMYLGRIVELAETTDLFERPRHPYTQALISAVPIPDPRRRRARTAVTGEVPSPLKPPSGCAFHPRCPLAFARCETESPPLYPLGNGHTAACFLVEEGAAA